MPQQPGDADHPAPHPWVRRRLRRPELTGRLGHPWATRRTTPDQRPDNTGFSSRDSSASGPTSGPPVTDAPPVDFLGLDALLALDEPSSGRSRSRPSVRRLGAGLVAMPPVTPIDPRAAVLPNAEVPERKRFCWSCDQPVGRASTDEPGAVTGHCPHCGSPFNFRPALAAGELVAGQYEVQGCLAHGGQGWLFLAIDRNVSDRWVVLKGVHNQYDFEAQVVAVAERQFLSEMAHPGIVKIYNFVKHRTPDGMSSGYIVMEYVGGRSLRKMADNARPDRLPVAEILAYLMEILPALDYLHALGLAYNDLKPDNVMVTEDEVKLIDLGAVAAMESYGSIYGTPGHQAPEITTVGPTVATDLFTVGRTVAAMTLDMPKDADGRMLPGLPDIDDDSPQRRYPALHRLLRRATDPDPLRRFPSAYDMYCQMVGVLRMVLATDTDREHPQASTVFGAMRGDFGTETLIARVDGMVDGRHREQQLDPGHIVAALPVPGIDSTDPCADLLSTLLHVDPRHALETLRRTSNQMRDGVIETPATFELEGVLVAVRAELDLGNSPRAYHLLSTLVPRYRADWRVAWYAGVAALLERDLERAYERFDDVHTMVPGEIAPLLALAATAEMLIPHHTHDTRWRDAATEHYRTVWRTNRSVISAAFGLARQLADAGACEAAVTTLDQVPQSSRHHSVARLTGSLLLVSRVVTDIALPDLREAATRLLAAPEDPRALPLRVVVLGAALARLRWAGTTTDNVPRILGFEYSESGLRRGLEATLRALARITPDRSHRYRLVDVANQVRPRSLW